MATLPGPDSAASKLNKLMARVYAPIVAAAFAHGLAVIDLPNTFDARNHHLYVATLYLQKSHFSLILIPRFF
jgi:hypothetical protein